MLYNYTKIIKPDILQAEIISSGLMSIHYIETVGDDVFIFFNEELTGEEQTQLDSIVDAHSVSISMQVIIKNKILAAMDFGRNLMAEYGASNILAGLSMEQIQEIMDKTIRIQAALNAGSLYIALNEIDLIETDEIVITPEKVAEFKQKIQTYLGI